MTEELQNLKNSCIMLDLAVQMIESKQWSGKDAALVAQVLAFLRSLHAQTAAGIPEEKEDKE